MSEIIFSVMIGQVSQAVSLETYLARLKNIEQGAKAIFAPLHMDSRLALLKRVCAQGDEWLDFRLDDGPQLSFLPILEHSLGRTVSLPELEAERARARVQLAIALLRELNAKRIWHAGDFLRFLDRTSLAISGRRMGSEQAQLTVQSPDGRRSTTPLLNQRASTLLENSLQIRFKPLRVGPDGARVQLSKPSRADISARHLQIEMEWQSSDETGMVETLFGAAKAHRWLSANCHVVANRDGIAKRLLVREIVTE